MNNIIPYKKAICYSGYRRGQSPKTAVFPSYEEILEDLQLLIKEKFEYIRMYDPNEHAERVLQAIVKEKLPLKVMVGIDPVAELDNPGCAWDQTVRTAEEIKQNMQHNDDQIEQLIALANKYHDYFLAVAVGNENRPSWGSDLVTEERLCSMAKRLKAGTGLPVSYCEGAYEWLELEKLVKELDFISIHSYPQWHKRPVENALAMNQEDYAEIQEKYPEKQVIFTECGWTTTACGEGMNPADANEENQKLYLEQLNAWLEENQITAFLFEAFDEPWKGSSNEEEPEKHWGIFREDRSKKLVLNH